MDGKDFYASFTINETKDLEEISRPTPTFKEDTNMFSSRFREGFDLRYLIMAMQYSSY